MSGNGWSKLTDVFRTGKGKRRKERPAQLAVEQLARISHPR